MMLKRSSTAPAALLTTVGFLVSLPVVSEVAGQTVGARLSESTGLIKAPDAGSLSAMRKLLIVVQPAGTLHSQIVEDAISVEMMTAGLTVISRERSVSIELALLQKAEKEAENKGQDEKGSESDADEANKNEVGPLGIAKATGADAIVSVTVLTDVVQHNIYDGQLGRVTEVRSEQVVLAVSCTVVRVSDGALLAAGCTDYSDKATSIVPAARSLGASLRELLR